MGHIQTYASVLSTEELIMYLKQDREKWCAMFHTCIKLFTPTPVYVSIYYISGRKWSTTHTLLKSHRSKTGIIYMQSWKQCDLPVITSMASLQLMHLAHDEQSCNGTSCAEGLICHIVIVVAGRAHCFQDCINLVPRAILKNSSLFSYSEKMRWGRGFITTAQSVNLFI